MIESTDEKFDASEPPLEIVQVSKVAMICRQGHRWYAEGTYEAMRDGFTPDLSPCPECGFMGRVIR